MVTAAFSNPIKVQTLDEPRKEIILNDQWASQKVLIKVFRRFGCHLCRYEAFIISKYSHVFSDLGIKLIGIGFDEEGLKEWQKLDIWNFDLYMDPKRELYKAVGATKLNPISGIIHVFNPGKKASAEVAKLNGLGGNMKGDGFQLGGTFLVGPEGEVLFEFLQATYADYPSLRQIVTAGGGNAELIDDDDENLTHAPQSCKA